MQRFTALRNCTPETIRAQLLPGEELLELCQSVGLYDGQEKDAKHDNGQLGLTTHRILYIDYAFPSRYSCALDLHHIRQTESWAGFMKSSPKITLTLGDSALKKSIQRTPSTPALSPVGTSNSSTWICRVCGFSNAPSPKCSLCGVTKAEYKPSPGSSAGNSSPVPTRTATPIQSGPPDSNDNRIACLACTYLNHPALTACEICGTSLAMHPAHSTQSSVRDSATQSTAHSETSLVRLSFRKGGSQSFYVTLKRVLLAKAWLNDTGPRSATSKPSAGIDGIMKTMDLDAQSRNDEMSDALSDLQALMAKAKEMVDFAQSLSDKLPSQIDGPDEATEVVAKSLISLGLPSPAVTQDMTKDEREYRQRLAKELASVLCKKTSSGSRSLLDTSGKEGRGRGIIPLDEAWCVWNRARGVSLVSPRDLQGACNYLSDFAPINIRTFKSGLSVLHTAHYSAAEFEARLLADLQRNADTGLPILSIARSENLAVTLAQELVEETELTSGLAVRDDKASDGRRYFPNLILSAT